MTLPTGNNITFSAINTELGRSATAIITLNDTQVRQLANVLSGAISINNLRGKTWATSFNTSVAGGQINVRSAALTNGWNTYGPVTCTINSNSYSNSTGTPTILITGNFPNGLTLVINSGVYVAGKGGTGGAGSGTGAGAAGIGGGVAISVTSYSGGTLTFVNNGFIGGGGGGGGGGGYFTDKSGSRGGGGGGGGAGLGDGGAGGTAAKGNGSAGAAGTINTAGAGGAAATSAGAGGSGGTLGTSGAAGGTATGAGGAGGGAGAATTGTVAANVVWSVTGTRYGTVG